MALLRDIFNRQPFLRHFVRKNRGRSGPAHIRTGDIGEDITAEFLKRKGFLIIGRNYRRKWGEIDIIAQKNGIAHFVEVKTTAAAPASGYRPEERVDERKRARLRRAIETYRAETRIGDVAFQTDIVAVTLLWEERRARVRVLENVIL